MRLKIFGRVIYIPSWVKFAFVVLLFVIMAIVGYSIRKNKNIVKENPVLLSDTQSPVPASPSFTIQPTSAHNTVLPIISAQPQTFTVYVVGCVVNPSVVTVPYGSIVQDAVDAAGGLTEDADPTRVNMAYPLSDNMMIKIPSVTETDNGISSKNDSWIVTSVPDVTPSATSSAPEGSSTDAKININTADIKELCRLPGIGESTAQKIIDFRKENGAFEHIEDIMKIPGIKQNRFDTIKNLITVG